MKASTNAFRKESCSSAVGGHPPYLGRVEKTDGEEMRVPEEEWRTLRK